MTVARRTLLLALVAAAPAVRLEPAGGAMVALTGPGVRRALLLPGEGARLLPGVACGGEALWVAGFVQGAVDWAVLALAQDGVVRVLALEPLAWRGADGARFGTRLSGTSDGARVLCRRDAAVPRGPTLWAREAWTDHLLWVAPAGLRDAPVRPPLSGTWQHRMAAWRRRAAGLVAGDPAAITPAALAEAGLQEASLLLRVSATPSMRQPSGRRTIV